MSELQQKRDQQFIATIREAFTAQKSAWPVTQVGLELGVGERRLQGRTTPLTLTGKVQVERPSMTTSGIGLGVRFEMADFDDSAGTPWFTRILACQQEGVVDKRIVRVGSRIVARAMATPERLEAFFRRLERGDGLVDALVQDSAFPNSWPQIDDATRDEALQQTPDADRKALWNMVEQANKIALDGLVVVEQSLPTTDPAQ